MEMLAQDFSIHALDPSKRPLPTFCGQTGVHLYVLRRRRDGEAPPPRLGVYAKYLVEMWSKGK